MPKVFLACYHECMTTAAGQRTVLLMVSMVVLMVSLICAAPRVVEAATMNLIYPNGGEFLRIGEEHHIRYTATGTSTSGSASIYLYLEKYKVNSDGSIGGLDEQDLIDTTASSTGYFYTVPPSFETVYGSDGVYKIRACARRNCAQDGIDRSADYFMIAPMLVLEEPNGGENFINGEQMTIQWDAENVDAHTVDISLIDSSYGKGRVIFEDTENDGEEIWTINALTPEDLNGASPSGAYTLHIACSENDCVADNSDDYFTIRVANPELVYTAPQKESTFTSGDVLYVHYDYKNLSGGYATTSIYSTERGRVTGYDKALDLDGEGHVFLYFKLGKSLIPGSYYLRTCDHDTPEPGHSAYCVSTPEFKIEGPPSAIAATPERMTFLERLKEISRTLTAAVYTSLVDFWWK